MSTLREKKWRVRSQNDKGQQKERKCLASDLTALPRLMIYLLWHRQEPLPLWWFARTTSAPVLQLSLLQRQIGFRWEKVRQTHFYKCKLIVCWVWRVLLGSPGNICSLSIQGPGPGKGLSWFHWLWIDHHIYTNKRRDKISWHHILISQCPPNVNLGAAVCSYPLQDLMLSISNMMWALTGQVYWTPFSTAVMSILGDRDLIWFSTQLRNSWASCTETHRSNVWAQIM